MTTYADFEFYQTTYGGKAFDDEGQYTPCAWRAALFLDAYTQGRAATDADNERIKLAACAIADEFAVVLQGAAVSRSADARMASQSVGSFSVSYRSGEELTAAAEKRMTEIARTYLAGTGLLYRGVGVLWD